MNLSISFFVKQLGTKLLYERENHAVENNCEDEISDGDGPDGTLENQGADAGFSVKPVRVSIFPEIGISGHRSSPRGRRLLQPESWERRRGEEHMRLI